MITVLVVLTRFTLHRYFSYYYSIGRISALHLTTFDSGSAVFQASKKYNAFPRVLGTSLFTTPFGSKRVKLAHGNSGPYADWLEIH